MTRREIYSIGMVLYHCIAGTPFFEAKEIDAMARKHVRSVRVSNFDQKMRKINPDLAEVLVKMIARGPGDRYQSFAEVEHELTRIVEKRLNGDNGKG
jgi:serine/threonine protein kinase